MDSELSLKLADFGFATDRTRSSNFIGTDKYMSPEQYAKKSYDCKQSDLWALGLILFIMVTGHPPYSIPDMEDPSFSVLMMNPEAFWDKIERCCYQNFEKLISPGFKDLVQRMLHVDPIMRPSLDDIKAHPWV